MSSTISESEIPELLPCGYLVGEHTNITITLKGKSSNIYFITVKHVMRGHLKKCPYMTGVPSSQVHFNVKVHFGSQKMQFRHPNFNI